MITMLDRDFLEFPPVSSALTDPDGLLAIGGDLSPSRLINAYRRGIFPWYQQGQPILWWSPNPRWIIEPARLHISRSLAKTLRKGRFRVTFNQDFNAVISACAQPGKDRDETWITADIQSAYTELHQLGYAHSVESWHQNQLVGGLYGIALGKVFFGESMFSIQSDASKVAMVYLTEKLNADGIELIDCQVHTQHLQSLGATPISRKDFITHLDQLITNEDESAWK